MLYHCWTIVFPQFITTFSDITFSQLTLSDERVFYPEKRSTIFKCFSSKRKLPNLCSFLILTHQFIKIFYYNVTLFLVLKWFLCKYLNCFFLLMHAFTKWTNIKYHFEPRYGYENHRKIQLTPSVIEGNDKLACTFCSFKNRMTVLESPNFMDSKESWRRLAS